jgi:hypothetical protein
MKTDTCETCKHFDPGHTSLPSTCRRYPPVTFIAAPGASHLKPSFITRFPAANEGLWCGEYWPDHTERPPLVAKPEDRL